MALDPYMEDYRDKVISDPILEPGDEMMPDDEQGLVSMLQDEQDPERKIMLAIQIIQSMGDRGIEIVESILSPEEIAMAVQVIQQMDTGADQGIDSIQMAAEGGRIGFERGGGISGRRPEGDKKRYDIADAYMDKITRQLGGGEVRGNPALQKARQDAMRKAELAEAKIAAAHGVASGQGTGGSLRSTYEPLLQAGINPEDLIDAETAAYIPETGFGNVGNEYVNMAVSALHPDFNAPVVAPDAPVVAPDAPVVAPETTIMPSAPSALDYASPAATPASPATDMSQYYSNLFSPESTSANAPSIASQIAAQYLSPQQAQVYAANGGRIGFQDGGDDYQSPPFIDDPAGTFDTDPMELREMIESEGTLKTASSMGDVFMQAMEDSSVLELDSWLNKYQPFGLREDDYFNFRTMGPQARGPEATEGLATLRV